MYAQMVEATTSLNPQNKSVESGCCVKERSQWPNHVIYDLIMQRY
jgi:hypothetical protein